MSEALEPEGISRRRALSLLGLRAALGLAVPRLLSTACAAAAPAVPPAFAQEDKPLPGEGSRARTAPQPEKPILGEPPVARRRRLRRKRVQSRRHYQRRRRGTPPEPQQPAGEAKPK